MESDTAVTSADLLATAERIAIELRSLMAGAEVAATDQSRVAMSLCWTIAEAFTAVLAILRSPSQTHAVPVVRTMHEALADLRNVAADATYMDQMHFDTAYQQLKTFEGFLSDPDIKDDEKIQKEMRVWQETEQRTFNELAKRGFKRLTVRDKFHKAGMVSEYATAYAVECGFTHGNLVTLVARHGGHGPIRTSEPLPTETLTMVVGIALSDFSRAVETLPSYTNLTEANVKGVMDHCNEEWAKVG